MHPIFNAHEWLHALWSCGETEFFKKLGGGPEDFADFWERCRGSSWAQGHPVYEDESQFKTTAPFALFGDDCGVYLNEKILMLLLAPTLNSQASSWDCRLTANLLPLGGKSKALAPTPSNKSTTNNTTADEQQTTNGALQAMQHTTNRKARTSSNIH